MKFNDLDIDYCNDIDVNIGSLWLIDGSKVQFLIIHQPYMVFKKEF